MQSELTQEHGWLDQLVGDWVFEGECFMGPDEPPFKATGRETVRSLGGYWTVGEGQGEMPCGGEARTLMTLGYDPRAKRYRGTWVGSMMDHLWVYDGAMSSDGRTLTLEAEGPSFAGDGKMLRYRDALEVVDRDTRILRASVLGDDGQWFQFMECRYTRV